MNKTESEAWIDELAPPLAHLHPKIKMELARSLLASLIDNGEITYANFQSAKWAEHRIRQAHGTLEKIT